MNTDHEIAYAARLPCWRWRSLCVDRHVAPDPLPSWNDGATKKAIVDFVAKVTKEGGPDFVPPDERIATFDNDGTLWCEQPMYFQELFAFDRVKAMAEKHPEWKDKEPFKFVLSGDLQGLAGRREGPVGDHGANA